MRVESRIRLVIAAAAALLAAPTTSAHAAPPLTIAFEGDLNSAIPQGAVTLEDRMLDRLVCDPLLDLSGVSRPRLVSMGPLRSLRASRDGRTVTVRLKKGLKFSDGRSVTAHDFRFGFSINLDPQVSGNGGAPFADVVGVRGEPSIFGTTYVAGPNLGITTSGDLQITFHLVRPFEPIRAALAGPSSCPLASGSSVGDPNALLPGAGPYSVESYSPGQEIHYRPNPTYTGGRPQPFPDIGVFLDRPASEAPSLIGSGPLIFVGSGPFSAPGYHSLAEPTLQVEGIFLNIRKTLLRRRYERYLLELELNRRELNGASLGPAGSAWGQLDTPGMPDFSKVNLLPLKPVPPRSNPLKGKHLGLWVSAAEMPVANVIKTDLSRIGVTVDTSTFPSIGSLYSAIQANPKGYDMVLGTLAPAYPDENAIYQQLLEEPNFSGFRDPALVRLARRAAAAPASKRRGLYRTLERKVLRSAVFVPYARVQQIVSLPSGLSGFNWNAWDGIDFARLRE